MTAMVLILGCIAAMFAIYGARGNPGRAVAEAVTLTVAAGEILEEVWLPVADDVQLRRVQLALGSGAKARIFALNTAPVYGRMELEVSLAEGADFELYGANIGTGLSTNEI